MGSPESADRKSLAKIICTVSGRRPIDRPQGDAVSGAELFAMSDTAQHKFVNSIIGGLLRFLSGFGFRPKCHGFDRGIGSV